VNIAALMDETTVCVCAGAGGVGKTTTAAALAAGMAQRGRRVLVLTIDPARRLAGALGLPETDDDEHTVDLAAHGMAGSGSLTAAMLDARRTFDALVREQAPTPEAAERILRNPIYQQLAGAVAGSHEYMAMERLYEVWSSGRFDLIVLDTPPSRHALDFLEAPGRVSRFVDGRALRLLVRPGVRAGMLGMRMFGAGPNMALGAVERLTGVSFLADLSEFLASFEGMYEGFQRRADEVSRLLASPETTFLLVTVPLTEPITEADFFWRALRERDLPFGGVVMNKVHPSYVGGGRRGIGARARRALHEAGVPEPAAARAAENLLHFQSLADRDRANIERLEERMGADAVVEVPLLEHDVHDLEGLAAVSRHLFAEA
jgi:anion-transporting  ArsA/GET3 family ATPase